MYGISQLCEWTHTKQPCHTGAKLWALEPEYLVQVLDLPLTLGDLNTDASASYMETGDRHNICLREFK